MSRSLAEFRAALNGIVNPARGSSPMVYHSDDPALGRQKRANVPQWVKMGGLGGQAGESEFLAPEPDYSEYQPISARQRKAAMRSAALPSRAHQGDIDDEKLDRLVGQLIPTKNKPARRSSQQQASSEPLTYKQAQMIGRSVGGMKTVCPTATPGDSFHAVLSRSVTKQQAEAIIAKMVKAGVAREHYGVQTSPAQQQQAAAILMKMSPFSCPVDVLSDWDNGSSGDSEGPDASDYSQFDEFLDVAKDNRGRRARPRARLR